MRIMLFECFQKLSARALNSSKSSSPNNFSRALRPVRYCTGTLCGMLLTTTFGLFIIVHRNRNTSFVSVVLYRIVIPGILQRTVKSVVDFTPPGAQDEFCSITLLDCFTLIAIERRSTSFKALSCTRPVCNSYSTACRAEKQVKTQGEMISLKDKNRVYIC